jgi:hypothetical protein
VTPALGLISPTLALNSSNLFARGLPFEVSVEINVVEAPDNRVNVEGERLKLVNEGVSVVVVVVVVVVAPGVMVVVVPPSVVVVVAPGVIGAGFNKSTATTPPTTAATTTVTTIPTIAAVDNPFCPIFIIYLQSISFQSIKFLFYFKRLGKLSSSRTLVV